jgi:hypothetical protein
MWMTAGLLRTLLHESVSEPYTVKHLLKVSLGTSGFEHLTRENLKQRKFNSEIIDPVSLKFHVQ